MIALILGTVPYIVPVILYGYIPYKMIRSTYTVYCTLHDMKEYTTSVTSSIMHKMKIIKQVQTESPKSIISS